MIKQLVKIYKPELYHGNNQKPPFFEGWFYKLVDPARQYIYAIIPGVFIAQKIEDTHAFIQILEGHTGKSDYIPFNLDEFHSHESEFLLQIGENSFSSSDISLNVIGEKLQVYGKLAFESTSPWPVRLWSPGVMGPYAFAPFMQCYHGVISMDHTMHGKLNINQQTIDFTNGRGYIEKDWGKSFPSAYIWAQCNHFETPGVSLMLSVANIPWVSGSFLGFLVGLLFEGRLYRFTTYTGAKLQKVSVSEKLIEIQVAQFPYEISIRIEEKTSGMLHGPYEAQMAKKVTESLNSEMHINFTKNGKTFFEGIGKASGLDVNGNLSEILVGD